MSENRIVLTTVYGRRVLIHLVEDQIERIKVVDEDKTFPVGTIVTGRVKKMLPSSNACFVSLGTDEDYFLTIPSNMKKIYFLDGKKHTSLHCEDEIVVQVTSEAVKLKQPTISNDIELTGRYCVIERGQGFSFSKKITAADKKRLKFSEEVNKIAENHRIVVRTETAALENSVPFEDECVFLAHKYDSILLKARTARDYTVLYSPENKIALTIKEWLKYGVSELVTDEVQYTDMFNELVLNEKNISFRFYDDEDYPLYALYKLESHIDNIIGKKVYLSSGGFLVVEQGETLTAIDVNSAHAIKGSKEDAVFALNIEAADKIGQILKNRNLNGMILVDFINMKSDEHEKLLISHMKNILAKDDVKAKYIDMTGLGLMEITRQRKYKTFIEQWKNNS